MILGTWQILSFIAYKTFLITVFFYFNCFRVPKVKHVHVLVFTFFKSKYRAFSFTWPAHMQTYWNKTKCLHKKRVQLPEDWFGTPTWPPFHCFGTLIWPLWRHVKTLYLMCEKSLILHRNGKLVNFKLKRINNNNNNSNSNRL